MEVLRSLREFLFVCHFSHDMTEFTREAFVLVAVDTVDHILGEAGVEAAVFESDEPFRRFLLLLGRHNQRRTVATAAKVRADEAASHVIGIHERLYARVLQNRSVEAMNDRRAVRDEASNNAQNSFHDYSTFGFLISSQNALSRRARSEGGGLPPLFSA